MKSDFLKKAEIGQNTWWRYVLSILAPVIVIALINVVLQEVLSVIKSLFPEGEFGKTLGTFSLVFIVFGAALVTFMLVASKLHKRPILSFITIGKKVNWTSYFIGFLAWGILLFLGGLVTSYDQFENFLQNFETTHFLILFSVGFLSIGIQSFFEELVIRGYWLQGLHLHIKKVSVLILVNALLFGVLHFGYGLESFLSSFGFGIAFVLIVILQNRIEFVSGAHNANNLILSLIFLDLEEAANESFSWDIDWSEFGLHIIALMLLTGLVYKFLKK
jgi:membrane protease YdiL (CAAX protease family)